MTATISWCSAGLLMMLTLLPCPAVAQDGSGVATLPDSFSYEPITGEQRFTWFGVLGPDG
jgi:hypothetical protein